MNRKEMNKNNPLRALSPDANGGGISQRMGLVMARAGIGKTAILVQIALDSLLRGKKVLHVNIGQSFEKTKIWYEDIFKDMVETYKLENSAEIMDEILPNRIIMTFKESSFSKPKLEERLNDLIYQNIFRPDCLMIDGLDFSNTDRQSMVEMRELMEAMDLHIWFSALLHREDERTSKNGVPAPCHEIDDLFDTVVLLRPEVEKKSVALDVIKDTTGSTDESGRILDLDPSTLMLTRV
ncbi:MAG: hypothetical protein KKE17_12520 [Proteobacteria bacterium]|nr:hypothetical protein [Pseudomonadota bacterium]MBU1710823.1 hypothetical protein [Pseudomonadota bacterium]